MAITKPDITGGPCFFRGSKDPIFHDLGNIWIQRITEGISRIVDDEERERIYESR